MALLLPFFVLLNTDYLDTVLPITSEFTDVSNRVPRKQGRQHSDLTNDYGEPYPRLEKTIKACADELYSIAVGAI